MGNTVSVENDLFVAPKGLCGKTLNNDHIAYITKQYITVLKAKSILERVVEELENDKKVEGIEDPCSLIFPLEVILADFIAGKPTQTSIQIFGSEQKQTIDHNARNVTVYNTVLNDYNNFFSIEYKYIKSDSDKVTRAKGLIKRLDESIQIALSILSESCDGVGQTCGELQQQATSSLHNEK